MNGIDFFSASLGWAKRSGPTIPAATAPGGHTFFCPPYSLCEACAFAAP